MEANGKIPLTLGFADLSDNDFAALIAEDSTALSPLFERVRVAPARNIPSAEILFVYTHLNENGTIRGSDRSGIRQVAQADKVCACRRGVTELGCKHQECGRNPGSKNGEHRFHCR
jgi:hypothetical protein